MFRKIQCLKSEIEVVVNYNTIKNLKYIKRLNQLYILNFQKTFHILTGKGLKIASL